MDKAYIVKVKKDANMELKSGSEEATWQRINLAVVMLFVSFELFIFLIYDLVVRKRYSGILPVCFSFIISILLFIDGDYKVKIDNSGICVHNVDFKTHRINFEDLIDIRIESHIRIIKYSRYLWYFLVIEFFDNDKIRKISLPYKSKPSQDKETPYNTSYVFSNEDVYRLMSLFIKKSQINENNKDIEQYKDIRTQNTNAMIEEKIEQGRKTIEIMDKIMIIVAFVAVLVVLGINVAVMVLLLK